MKLQIKYLFTLLIIICTGCSDAIDLYPKDKISGEILFSDPEGVKLYMANLYHQLPIEDFSYSPHSGFYKLGEAGNGGFVAAMYTEEACHSEWGEFLNNNNNKWWEEGYKLNRDVNLLIEAIPGLDIEESEKKRMTGESAFIRAYLYFALAKRYGGVCLIKEVQEYKGDVESLKVPRSTEKETWDFVLEECDRAIENLPESWSGGERRATKWAAYALKSKASLFAASVAKHSQKAPLSGEAANQKLIGMDASEADRYYRACIEASEAIMNSGIYFLYKSSPSSVEEAIENYREMFEDPNIAPE